MRLTPRKVIKGLKHQALCSVFAEPSLFPRLENKEGFRWIVEQARNETAGLSLWG